MLIFDLETDGLLDEVTKIHCLVMKDTERDAIFTYSVDQWAIETGLRELARAASICGHNIVKYDLPVIKKLYPWFEYTGVVRDTILCTRLIWPNLKELDFENPFTALPKQLYGRHSLESWGYRLGERKGDFGKTTDWKIFTPEMLEYCKQDVEVTSKLWSKIESKHYSEQAIQLEHDFCEVIALQERHGFMFDREAAVKLYSELGQRRLDLEKQIGLVFPGWDQPMKMPAYYTAANGAQFATKKEAGKLAKGCTVGPVKVKHIAFNPSSRDHISRALIETHGWKPKSFTPDGKPTVDESVLSELVYPEAKLLNEYFTIEKRIGQLAEGTNAWLKLEKKGRIHGEVNTNGAVTGRCTHNRPNMAQCPAVGNPYGSECRSLFIVPPGFKLVGCDASGLELRMLAHFMARYDGGAYAKELLEGDIHTANLRAAPDVSTRAGAKKFIYMYLYGAGDSHIGETFGQNAAWGKKLKATFLAKTPGLKRLKEDVSAAAKRGYLIGLDGRHLPIRSEHAALNTLLQSAGALIVKRATVLLYRDLLSIGWKFGVEFAQVAHVHDEIQTEVREDLCEEYGTRAVAAMRAAGDSFGIRCRTDGEWKAGRNWAETH